MILTYEELKADFSKRLDSITNKKLFIQDELKHIEVFLNHKNFETPSKLIFGGFPTNGYKPKSEKIETIFNHLQANGSWDTFIKAYEHYYYNEDEIEFTPFRKAEDETESENRRFNKRFEQYHIQGLEFAKYSLWLNTQLENGSEKKQSKQKNFLTLNQKLLALHYLGLDVRKFQNNKQASIMLSHIIGMDWSNIKEGLTYFEGKNCKVKKTSNIKKVLELFDNESFKSIQDKIKEDLEK